MFCNIALCPHIRRIGIASYRFAQGHHPYSPPRPSTAMGGVHRTSRAAALHAGREPVLTRACAEEIRRERQSKALPIMSAMEAWMEAVTPQCTPSDLMGKALGYAYKLWPRMQRYTLDGRYQIDNNAVERSQRSSVLGRKNYLFSKNDRGAEENAVFYSLLESCNIVGVNPLQWLTHVLTHLHHDSPQEDILRMLPYNYKQSRG